MFLESLPNSKANSVLTFQLAKASTLTGSNYEEAQAAESEKDFINKIGIVLNEAREGNYWLRVLDAILEDSFKYEKCENILSENFDFKKIFSSIKLTSQHNLTDKK